MLSEGRHPKLQPPLLQQSITPRRTAGKRPRQRFLHLPTVLRRATLHLPLQHASAAAAVHGDPLVRQTGKQPVVSSLQPAVHVRSPSQYGDPIAAAQSFPPRFPPSHCSPLSTRSFPQTGPAGGTQLLASNLQAAVHARVPVQPGPLTLAQVATPSRSPSHSSAGCSSRSPQVFTVVVHLEVSKPLQSDLQESVPVGSGGFYV